MLVIVEVKARKTYDAGAYAVTPMTVSKNASCPRSEGAGWPLAAHRRADPIRLSSWSVQVFVAKA